MSVKSKHPTPRDLLSLLTPDKYRVDYAGAAVVCRGCGRLVSTISDRTPLQDKARDQRLADFTAHRCLPIIRRAA